RIARECFRRREIFSAVVAPQTAGAAEGRNAAFGGDAGARENDYALRLRAADCFDCVGEITHAARLRRRHVRGLKLYRGGGFATTRGVKKWKVALRGVESRRKNGGRTYSPPTYAVAGFHRVGGL